MIHSIEERPPDGWTWSSRRLTRKQTTLRPDNVWPDMWKHISDAAKSKAKQKWAIETPKLDNARRLRGIFFIEPNDEEFKQQCLVKHQQIAAEKLAAVLGNARSNLLVLLMPTNL